MSTNPEYSEKGSAEVIYLDYANIVKVVVKNTRIFIDDGLISIIVKEIGIISSSQIFLHFLIFNNQANNQ